MKFFFLLTATLTISTFTSTILAKPSKAVRIERQVKSLKEEIADLNLSIESLESLSQRLKNESEAEEENFKSRLSSLVVHLIQWPEKRWGLTASSWTELQRAHLVLENVRQSLVKSPLKMISDRELRLNEIEGLSLELQAQRKDLESKHSSLDVQLKELRRLNAKSKKPPQATIEKKKKLEVVE
ncbi:MAG: hypothetical protein ACO3LE_05915 [Bdellovibrionota bacterium]